MPEPPLRTILDTATGCTTLPLVVLLALMC